MVAAMPRNSTGMGVAFRRWWRHAGMAESPRVRAWADGPSGQAAGPCSRDGVRGRKQRSRGSARVENSARDGVTEGGEGRSDGPLPSQAQHAADHTRPKSM
ncbi:hypothetical protein EASAB2608_00144 [Streptomyces sp. EAS-AB2608]|uniref:Uncharacterized protein n=1 Tax=Streptomyces bangladeshensis TaxID=295352 RepID=A0ABP5N928_9ACTN|nr:hypothetical protein EASAB2608_00144 [Streptomyces sp. EAS-AB2608]